MHEKIGIVWFRQDLRLHDNEALTEALRHCSQIIPVFIFDERVFEATTNFGFQKTGKFRTKFILESVKDLKQSLQGLGSDLVVKIGKPETIIFDLAQQYKTSWVFCNRERTAEEVEVQDALEQKLWSIGQEVRFSRGKMLYYTADLPFPITHTPDIFAHFRKEVERFVQIREPLGIPAEKLNPLPESIEVGVIPNLKSFGFESFEFDHRADFQFIGGETEGLKRLKSYFENVDSVNQFKGTRESLAGENSSTKFSPWLAQGCLSPKMIFSVLKDFEEQHGKSKSTYAIFYELMLRDWLRLMGKKHGEKIFLKEGIKGIALDSLKNDIHLLQIWKEARTGIPLIDANMRELNATGYISSRGRLNVASFLIHDLKVNWQMGASYFESLLIDYDPCSNWGNWNHLAGVGSDTKDEPYFNILAQSKKYDPQGEYIKNWIPELNQLSGEKIHRLDILEKNNELPEGFKIGVNYPKAMVSFERWE